MRFQFILRKLLCVALLAQSTISFAFETDQYNLPPQPLVDIGDEVSQYVEANIKKAIDKLNAEILLRQSCLNNQEKFRGIKCDSPEKEELKLAQLRSPQIISREVYSLLGGGIPPFTNSETWLETHRFSRENVRYKTNFRDSIYFTFPTDFIGLGSTVRLYNTQFGTDKIAHFFQQGYTYYKIYNSAINKGLSSKEAAQKAVSWGQKTERTIYGTLISGVYSNADLYANYAGMKFYLRLTQPILIGDTERPATLILKDGLWTFNDENNLPNTLLKPFISNHLNEALNPSIFTNFLGLRPHIRRIVKKQSCQQWRKQFPDLSPQKLEEILQEIKYWDGEDYGFTDSRNFITISNSCFDDKAPAVSAD